MRRRRDIEVVPGVFLHTGTAHQSRETTVAAEELREIKGSKAPSLFSALPFFQFPHVWPPGTFVLCIHSKLKSALMRQTLVLFNEVNNRCFRAALFFKEPGIPGHSSHRNAPVPEGTS